MYPVCGVSHFVGFRCTGRRFCSIYMAGSGRHSSKALLFCDKRHQIPFRNLSLVAQTPGRNTQQIIHSTRKSLKSTSMSASNQVEVCGPICVLVDIRSNCRSVRINGRSDSLSSTPFVTSLPMYNPNNSLLNQYLAVRQFHSSNSLSSSGEPSSKPSSKVEETVKALTEAAIKEKTEGIVVPPPKRPLYKRIQDEILHYYHGFRLLFIDMKISNQLIWRILNGKSLSRREYKQLIRTTSDVFRLVPFSVFIIVPFMELLLPVFLKFFPGMLPSTFQTTSDRDSKMKTELKVKLEMAKFLQETLDEMAPQTKGRSSQTAKEFAEFISKIRDTGAEVNNTEIMKYSKLFEDEITLDTLSRPLLLALCRLLEIPAYGTLALLRFQLRMRLRNLAADDQIIENEGVSALNYTELQNACKARGMRAVGVTEERLRRSLEQWLQLSLHEKVPPSLLLLSRAMYVPDTLPASAQLQATLSALPESAALQTKAAIGEREGKVDNKTRIELIREEERLIKEERQEAKAEKEATPLPKDVLVDSARQGTQDLQYKAPQPAGSIPIESATSDIPLVSELGPEPYRPFNEKTSVSEMINNVINRKYVHPPRIAEDNLTAKDLEAIEDALERLGKDKKEMILEKGELTDLKEEMADYQEDLHLLEAMGDKKVRVNKGAQRLFTKLSSMISDLERSVDSTDAKKTEVKAESNLVVTEELIAAMRQIKTVEDDPEKVDRIARVLSKLDDDRDGKIEVDDLVKVIEIVGRENMNMTSKQLEEIVSILAKEETLEEQKKAPQH